MALHTHECKTLVNQYVEKFIPRQVSTEWMDSVSGESRFGWDIHGIQIGFTDVFYKYFDEFSTRIRPIFLIRLIEAFDLKLDQFSTALSALEMLYIASMMVDDLENVKSIALITKPSPYPTSVLLTAAYSIRQFAPAIIGIFDTKISFESKAKLTYLFGSYLFRQGMVLSLDYWNYQQKNNHKSFSALLDHIKMVVTPLSFTLVTDIIFSIAKMTDSKIVSVLSQSSEQLGFSYRLRQIADSLNNQQQSKEPRIRWLNSDEPDLAKKFLTESAHANRRFLKLIKTMPDSLAHPIIEFAHELTDK